jgi:hypothetical protein
LAKQLVATATRRGLGVEFKELNAVGSGAMPTDRPVAIVTTSYEGQVSILPLAKNKLRSSLPMTPTSSLNGSRKPLPTHSLVSDTEYSVVDILIGSQHTIIFP